MKSEEPRKTTTETTARKKKAYRRPEILYREKLEAMAALCVPNPPAKMNVGQCPTGPIAS
jgi:hypothetical protein